MGKLFQQRVGSQELRLDAAESYWLNQQLRSIDTVVYKQLYADLIGRQLVPIKSDIPSWAPVLVWREMDIVGNAKIITSMSDDLPRSDALRREVTKTIKMIGSSYAYNWEELQIASAFDTNLETDRAFAARLAIETKIDEMLALGDSTVGITGLLNQTGTQTFTPGTKAAGGLTWGTLQAPNATGVEVFNDIVGMCAALAENSQNMVQKFDVVLPIGQYNYASQARMTTLDSTKALESALASPFVNSITPWFRSKGAGSGSTDRMTAYAKNPLYLAGVVPLEYTPQPAQQHNLEWIVNAIAKCGGVVSRYPFLISYADGI